MNYATNRALKAAIALAAPLVAASASAQVVTYARGSDVWNTTVSTVVLTDCRICHNGVTAPDDAGLRVRFAALSETDVRARINTAIGGGVPVMAIYATLAANDRNAVAIYLGNFIASATVAATIPLTSLTAPAVGQTGTSILTITNTGANALVISNMAFSGVDAPQFSRVNTGTPCVATIAINASCQEFIRFTPTSTGTKTATLTISHDRNPNGTTLAVSGSTNTGAPPPGGGGLPSGGGGGGGAVWPVALLLLAAAALRRRRLH